MPLRSIAVVVLLIAGALGLDGCGPIHVDSQGYGTYYHPGGENSALLLPPGDAAMQSG
jgi:hypothetical protein